MDTMEMPLAIPENVPMAPEMEMPTPSPEIMDIPPMVQESFNNEARATLETMTPESRNFARQLYENIKSSDVVQNVADRVQAWQSDLLRARAEDQMRAFEMQRTLARDSVDHFTTSRANLDQSLETIQQAGLGKMSDELKAKTEQEAQDLESRVSGAQKIIKQFDDKVKNAETAYNGHKEIAEQARGRIGERMGAKIASNQEAVSSLASEQRNIEFQMKRNQEQIDKLRSSATKEMPDATPAERMATTRQSANEANKYARENNKLEKLKTKLKRGQAKLASRNSALEEILNRIIPRSETPQPEKVDVDPIVIDKQGGIPQRELYEERKMEGPKKEAPSAINLVSEWNNLSDFGPGNGFNIDTSVIDSPMQRFNNKDDARAQLKKIVTGTLRRHPEIQPKGSVDELVDSFLDKSQSF